MHVSKDESGERERERHTHTHTYIYIYMDRRGSLAMKQLLLQALAGRTDDDIRTNHTHQGDREQSIHDAHAYQHHITYICLIVSTEHTHPTLIPK